LFLLEEQIKQKTVVYRNMTVFSYDNAKHTQFTTDIKETRESTQYQKRE